jgi:putative hydrolase of the HAD superfamily
MITGKHMIELKRIRAVSFDVGGTLIEACPSVGHIYAQVAAEFGVTGLDPAALASRFDEVWKARGEFDYSQEAWYGLVRRTFAAHASKLPAGFYPALYARFEQAEAWRIFGDVRPALDELASHGVPLAIVSNWDTRLVPLLRNLNLDRLFEVIIPSRVVAFHKPSPVIFELLVRRLGLPPEDILHVGDHYQEDVEGARAAGLQALQLVRGSETRASYQIHSLLDLPAIVELAGRHLLTMETGKE